MTTRNLETSVRHIDGTAIIDLTGEINALGEDALNSAYAEAVGRSPSSVLLNFADVDYINSAGIALIVGILAQARGTDTRVMTAGLSDHYLEIFRVTRLSEFMTIFSDVESALADTSGEA